MTRRQQQVYALLMAGNSNKEIALRLGVALNTVKAHVYSIYKMLGVVGHRSVRKYIAAYREERARGQAHSEV